MNRGIAIGSRLGGPPCRRPPRTGRSGCRCGGTVGSARSATAALPMGDQNGRAQPRLDGGGGVPKMQQRRTPSDGGTVRPVGPDTEVVGHHLRAVRRCRRSRRCPRGGGRHRPGRSTRHRHAAGSGRRSAARRSQWSRRPNDCNAGTSTHGTPPAGTEDGQGDALIEAAASRPARACREPVLRAFAGSSPRWSTCAGPSSSATTARL